MPAAPIKTTAVMAIRGRKAIADYEICAIWLSNFLLLGLGAPLYPQAIQRIYAARSARSLRLSLAVMVFLPLTTALVALIVGIMGLAHVPDLSEQLGPNGELLRQAIDENIH